MMRFPAFQTSLLGCTLWCEMSRPQMIEAQLVTFYQICLLLCQRQFELPASVNRMLTPTVYHAEVSALVIYVVLSMLVFVGKSDE